MKNPNIEILNTCLPAGRNPKFKFPNFKKPLTPPSPHRGEDQGEGVLF